MKREELCVGDIVIASWYKGPEWVLRWRQLSSALARVTIVGFIDGGARCSLGSHTEQLKFEDILSIYQPSPRKR